MGMCALVIFQWRYTTIVVVSQFLWDSTHPIITIRWLPPFPGIEKGLRFMLTPSNNEVLCVPGVLG
ncbi:hypothetical protein L208DRAFT_1392431 [Tricholoma matsutake]|nr:hypothetical protein L208DRAFT_1392431 [Tricholoma matsutake 945]